jgi:hypothetical protein
VHVGGCPDSIQGIREVVEDIFVGNAQDPEVHLNEQTVSKLVTGLLITDTMNDAIDLDNKTRFRTVEVRDIPGDRMLAAKLQSIKLMPTKRLPQPSLGSRLVPSQVSNCRPNVHLLLTSTPIA